MRSRWMSGSLVEAMTPYLGRIIRGVEKQVKLTGTLGRSGPLVGGAVIGICRR